MFYDWFLDNWNLLNKSYFMKKIIYFVNNASFTICRARPTLTKNFMLWKQKKPRWKSPLKFSEWDQFFIFIFLMWQTEPHIWFQYPYPNFFSVFDKNSIFQNVCLI